MSHPPLASIIIPTWNGKIYLEDCLKSLLSQAYPHFEVIIVDNASSDGTPDWVAAHFPTVTLIRNERNLGFAGGVNVGLVAAQGEVLILFNQDAAAEPGWLEAMVNGLTASPDIGIVGCKIYYWGGKTIWHAGVRLNDPRMHVVHQGENETDQGQYEQLADVDAVTGAALGIKRAILRTTGLFDEDYFVYFEDMDFCWRVRQAGYRVVYVPTAVAQHHVSSSLGFQSIKTYEQYQRSRMLFLLKHCEIAWLYNSFLPAELAWLNQGMRFSEYRMIRQIYLETLAGLIQGGPPYQFTQQRFNEEQRQEIVDLLSNLAKAAVEALLAKTEERPWLFQGEETGNWWQVVERPFVSTVPFLGPLIAGFRTAWNNMAARWYVRGLLVQQLKINQRLVLSVEMHNRLIQDLNNEIISLRQELAQRLAEPDVRNCQTASETSLQKGNQ